MARERERLEKCKYLKKMLKKIIRKLKKKKKNKTKQKQTNKQTKNKRLKPFKLKKQTKGWSLSSFRGFFFFFFFLPL